MLSTSSWGALRISDFRCFAVFGLVIFALPPRSRLRLRDTYASSRHTRGRDAIAHREVVREDRPLSE